MTTSNFNYISLNTSQGLVYINQFNEVVSSKMMKEIIKELQKLNHLNLNLNLNLNVNLNLNSFEAKAIKMLVKHLKKSRLENLSLNYSYLIGDGLKYLGRYLIGAQLKSVNLSSTQLGDEALNYILNSLNFSKLETLNLINSGLGPKSLNTLVRKLKNSSLKILDLKHNELNQFQHQYPFIKELMENLHNTNLQELGLGGNQLDSDAARSIANAFPKSFLKKLKLDWNATILNMEVINQLINNLKGSSLTHLNLSGCWFTHEGSKDFFNKLAETKILNLNLSACDLTEKEAIFIAEYLERGRIQCLKSLYNQLESSGEEIIAEAIRSGLVHPGLKIISNDTSGMIQKALNENQNNPPLDETTKDAVRTVLNAIKNNTDHCFQDYAQQLNSLLPQGTSLDLRKKLTQYILNRLNVYLKCSDHTKRNFASECLSQISFNMDDKQLYPVYTSGRFFKSPLRQEGIDLENITNLETIPNLNQITSTTKDNSLNAAP